MRLATGLKKLQDTNLSIADFKIKIEELQPQLIKKNEEISKALVVVAADKKVADEKEKVVSEEAKEVNKKKVEAEEIANDAQRDLKAAEPEMIAARKAVSSLDKSSVVEIKSMNSPPKGVVMVMESVMILLGEKTAWSDIKSSLQDVGKFINTLMNFELKNCPEKAFEKVRKNYLARPEFDPE